MQNYFNNNRDKRRRKRPSVAEQIELNEGFSTDEEGDDAESNSIKQSAESVGSKVCADLNEEFFQMDLIKQRFEKWKTLDETTYRSSFVSVSLPKLLSPLVRLELISWNPLELAAGGHSYLERSKWFRQLLTYCQEDLATKKDRPDDDFFLIPQIVEKTVLPKLVALAESVYDPMSSRQTANFSSLVLELAEQYPTLNSQSSNTKVLIFY